MRGELDVMDMEKVSVILPVYNEEKVLEKTIKTLSKTLDKIPNDYEIIISEDGSTDKTPQIARSLRSKKIRTIHNGKRTGKGAAIRNAANCAKGELIIFMDADLASHPNHIKELIRLLEKDAAIVIGSRYIKGAKTMRAPLRYLASKSFNFLVNFTLNSKLSDHQCGFKAFKKNLVIPVINEVENEKWFWDTEFLVRAQRKGLNVIEVPIEWKEARDSKFNLIHDTIHMTHRLIHFKLKHR